MNYFVKEKFTQAKSKYLDAHKAISKQEKVSSDEELTFELYL